MTPVDILLSHQGTFVVLRSFTKAGRIALDAITAERQDAHFWGDAILLRPWNLHLLPVDGLNVNEV